jgi:hypothetical protein
VIDLLPSARYQSKESAVSRLLGNGPTICCMSQQGRLGMRVVELVGPPGAPGFDWRVARRAFSEAWQPVGVAGLAFTPVVALGVADGGSSRVPGGGRRSGSPWQPLL